MKNTTATSLTKENTKQKLKNLGAQTPKNYYFYGEITNGIKIKKRGNR